MHNKKILSAIGALAVSVTLIGGTLAWFTSTDSVTNTFTTAGLNTPEPGEDGDGVEIYEKFEEPKNVLPGDENQKLVQIKNTSTYDSFIRVKITPKWTDNKLDANKILLGFGNNLTDSKEAKDEKWLLGDDGYYYYMGKVASGKFTNPLLEKVTLSIDAGNEYRDAKYEVIVEAESIQADNKAYESEWKDAGKVVHTKLESYEGKTSTGVDKITGVEAK